MRKMLTLGFLLVAGCRTMSGMEEEASSTDGDVRSYPMTPGKALELAKVVLKEQGADDFKEGGGYVIGSFYLNLVTPGSYCGVYVKETPAGCDVRVLSRRKAAVSIFTGLTESGFHTAFSEKLRVAQK